MTAPILHTDLTELDRETLGAPPPDVRFALHLIDAGGRLVYVSQEHTRAFCLAMVDTLLWLFPEANGWELVCLATGEPVMAGIRGEGTA